MQWIIFYDVRRVENYGFVLAENENENNPWVFYERVLLYLIIQISSSRMIDNREAEIIIKASPLCSS